LGADWFVWEVVEHAKNVMATWKVLEKQHPDGIPRQSCPVLPDDIADDCTVKLIASGKGGIGRY